MAYFRILTVFICLPILTRALIQSRDFIINSTVNCQDEFDWTFSKERLSPCFLLAAVTVPCHEGTYIVSSLPPGNHYDYPNKNNGRITRCECSWAAYNLLSACTACQGLHGGFTTWSSYSEDCGDDASTTAYWPSNFRIANNHTIPYYAGTNPNDWKDHQFNVVQAQTIAAQNNPDLTGAPILAPDSPATQKKATPIGAIVGGTVGGALLVLLLLLSFCIYRRRRASLGVQEVQARRRPSFFSHSHSHSSSGDWEARKRGISMVSYSSLGSVFSSPPFTPTTAPSMYTTYDGTTRSFSQRGSASMYTTPPQPSLSYQRLSGAVSPAPTMQTTMSGPPDHIQPFTLMDPGASPDTLAHKRKASTASVEPVMQSVMLPTLPVQVTAASGQQGPSALTPENARHLETVAEEECHAGVSGRGRSESQPPAYTLHPTPSDMPAAYEVAIARREVNGHGHRPVESSPRKGSQDSQTSSGGGSRSTINPTTDSQGQTREEVLQTPRPDRDQRYRSVMSTESRDDYHVA